MLVRITAGAQGVGQILDLPPAVALARINGGTAVPVDQQGKELKRETAALDIESERGKKPGKLKAKQAR